MPQIQTDFSSLDLRPDTGDVTSIKFKDLTAGFPDVLLFKTVDQVKFIDKTVSPNTEQIVWAKPYLFTVEKDGQDYIDIYRDSSELEYINTGLIAHDASAKVYHGDCITAKVKVPEGYTLEGFQEEGSGITYEPGNIYTVVLPKVIKNDNSLNYIVNKQYDEPTITNISGAAKGVRGTIHNSNSTKLYCHCDISALYQYLVRDDFTLRIETGMVFDSLNLGPITLTGTFINKAAPQPGWLRPRFLSCTIDAYFYILDEASGDKIKVSQVSSTSYTD